MMGQVDGDGRDVVGEGCLRGARVGLWPIVGRWGVCGETCVVGLLSGENGWNRGSERRPMCRMSAKVVSSVLGIWVERA